MTTLLSQTANIRAATGAGQRLDAFTEKYRQFFPRVFAYVYVRVRNLHLSEDLVADVF